MELQMTAQRAFVYVRVSTSQQAQNDLSIPDQKNQIRSFAEKRGWEIVDEFMEPGASARSDQRPVFQDMMARALAKPTEVDVIVVHSMSRLFRDEMYYELYRRKLEKNGVRIVSITQDFGDGPGADLTRRIMALTDEINSIENAKHVSRAMAENARQNYWNGSSAPLGYKSVTVEIRGTKQKKRLEIEPEGAEVIRLIYRLYLDGDGQTGPLGTKNIVKYLNDRGFQTPRGGKFHVSYVNKILRDETYVGRAWYNKFDSRAKTVRPKEEWIASQVPAIINEQAFNRVGTQLTERSPKKTAPRLVNSPVLLTGVAVCGGCGALMHRRTGKGGTYNYYRCSGKALKGSCEGGAPAGIAAPLLDRIVLDRLLDELLTPERLQSIVAHVAAKHKAGGGESVASLGQLQDQRAKSTKKLAKLIDMLAEGIVEASETYKANIKATEADCERLARLIAAQERSLNAQLKAITLDEARIAATQLREKLLSSAPSLQKRIIRSFVGKIVVTAEEIVITGADSDLAEVVTGTPTSDYRPANDIVNTTPKRVFASRISSPTLYAPVPTFEREWWSIAESNR
ncbi:recombinase family protein [Asticcacaulis taihuensis]|uniref:recombinase family protein n=1 Tax=Asticcacaulis taihuensis TaxID=260084 RepID=UPI003F7C2243